MLKFNTAADIHEASTCNDDYRCNICYYGEELTEHTQHKGSNVTNVISCNHIQFGDYDNSCMIERANVAWLKEIKLVEKLERESYGFEKAWLLDTEENRELLNSLFNYPCFDDELVSNMESELETEYIKDCGHDLHSLLSEDMQQALQELYIFDDIDTECYYKACEVSNTYFEVESGGNGYIDFKRIVQDYAILLCDKFPAIKSLCHVYETVNNIPSFPCDFYENMEDMNSHKASIFELYSQDEIKDIVEYTIQLEQLIDAIKA